MSQKAEDEREESSDYTQLALGQLRRLRVLLAIRKVHRDFQDFDKSEELLRSGMQERSENANANLQVNRDLEAMKPRLKEKEFDDIERLALFGRKVKGDGITDENLPQAALEFHRASPSKAKFTELELKVAIEKAAYEAAARQKVEDGVELAKYKEYADDYLALLLKDLKRQNQEAHRDRFGEEVDVVSRWHKEGLIFTWKDVLEMLRTGRLRPGSTSSPQTSATSAAQTSSQPDPTMYEPPITVSLGKDSGTVSAGGSVSIFMRIYPCHEHVDLGVRGLPGIGGKYNLKPWLEFPSIFEGQTILYIPTSVPLGLHEMVFVAEDSQGRTGTAKYHLTVVRNSYPGMLVPKQPKSRPSNGHS